MAVAVVSSSCLRTVTGRALASPWSSATRFSMAVRRALASSLSASTRALTTVSTWVRMVLGSKSKSLTDFCTPSKRVVASFCRSTSFFCTSETYSRTVSTARSTTPAPAYRDLVASDLRSSILMVGRVALAMSELLLR